MSNNYEKYLKYKKKYMDLSRNQQRGGETYISGNNNGEWWTPNKDQSNLIEKFLKHEKSSDYKNNRIVHDDYNICYRDFNGSLYIITSTYQTRKVMLNVMFKDGNSYFKNYPGKDDPDAPPIQGHQMARDKPKKITYDGKDYYICYYSWRKKPGTVCLLLLKEDNKLKFLPFFFDNGETKWPWDDSTNKSINELLNNYKSNVVDTDLGSYTIWINDILKESLHISELNPISLKELLDSGELDITS